jgi:hypothetical protein
MPGARVIDRVLARTGSAARTVRFAYLDVPVAAHDSVQSAWRAPGVRPVFGVRCPVLAAPALRPLIDGVGAEAFVNLLTCGSALP